MSLKSKDVDKAWKKLGMVIKKSKDRHALLYVDGKMVIRTMRSHGSGQLDGQIPQFIMKQMKLDKAQFKDLIDCPLKREGYIQILIDKGVVEKTSP